VLEAFRWRQFVLSIPNAAAFEIPGLSKTGVRTLEKNCTDGLTDCAMGWGLGVVGGDPAATDAAPADVFLFSSLPTPDAR
jgi:hypothetical protein